MIYSVCRYILVCLKLRSQFIDVFMTKSHDKNKTKKRKTKTTEAKVILYYSHKLGANTAFLLLFEILFVLILFFVFLFIHIHIYIYISYCFVLFQGEIRRRLQYKQEFLFIPYAILI